MLKEKVFFQGGLPVNVYVAEVEEYPIHFHDEIEIIYVLDGTVTMKNGYYTYSLKEGDVFIFNDREIHSLYATDKPNMIVFFQISLDYFSQFYKNLKNSFFVADMKNEDDETLNSLRLMILNILHQTIIQERDHEEKVISCTNEVLECLMEDFLYFSMNNGKFINDPVNKGNKVLAERLRRITDYMYENHGRKLTLTEIAENEHLNVYYLSHVIRESAGMSFQELLNFIRVEESEKLLLGSSKKISAIAAESGFSAVRYYIKYFKKWFGAHPEEYRSTYIPKVQGIKTAAKYRRCSNTEIREAIKANWSEAYFRLFCDEIFHNRPINIKLGKIVQKEHIYEVNIELSCKDNENEDQREALRQFCIDARDEIMEIFNHKFKEKAN